jgi:hypothetical protein
VKSEAFDKQKTAPEQANVKIPPGFGIVPLYHYFRIIV